MASALIIRFGALGDMILTTPVMRALAQRHGGPCALACAGGWNRSLFAHLPYVGEIHSIDSRGAPYWFSPGQQRLVRFMSAYREQPVYCFEGDDKSHWLAAKAGLTLTASNRQLINHDNQHQVQVHARLGSFVQGTSFADGFDPAPEIRVSDEERRDCMQWLAQRFPGSANLVLVHPGNKKTASWRKRSNNLKEWSVTHWVTVINGMLAHDPGLQVLITGSRHERAMTSGLASAVGDQRVTSIAGETSLRRLFALLSIARSLVSVDTGPAHAAGAVGCPLVVLFGETDPRANRPLSRLSPVVVVTGPPGAPELPGEAAWRAHHHMRDIDPQAVLTAWRSLADPLVRPGPEPLRPWVAADAAPTR